jgi:hypothetical protein
MTDTRELALRLAREALGDKAYSALTYSTGPYEVTEPTVDLVALVRLAMVEGLRMGADLMERIAAACNEECSDAEPFIYAREALRAKAEEMGK